MKQHKSNIVKAKDEVIGVVVKNAAKEKLGKICELMLDKFSGRTIYAVLESDGFLGMGEKLFALPWNAFHYDAEEECFILNIEKEKLKNAPGFDKDHWPDTADSTWLETISEYYGEKSFTESE